MKKVVIMRGPSGSGKSTYIREKLADATVVSADHFFMKKDEEGNDFYDFNPSLLGQAHNACLLSFIQALHFEIECVVVDNTHIHKWEFQHYKAIAELAGYEVEIIEFQPHTIEEIKKCIARNTHGVPVDIVARMCIEFEPDEDAKNSIRIT